MGERDSREHQEPRPKGSVHCESFVYALLLSSGHRPTALGAVATASQNPADEGGGTRGGGDQMGGSRRPQPPPERTTPRE